MSNGWLNLLLGVLIVSGTSILVDSSIPYVKVHVQIDSNLSGYVDDFLQPQHCFVPGRFRKLAEIER